MLYVVILVFVVIFSFFDYRKKSNTLPKLLSLSFLILFVGTRLEIGNDWENYTRYFYLINSEVLSKKFELGYTYLNLFVKRMGGGINEVFLLSSVIIILLTARSINFYTNLWFIPMLLYLRFSYLQTNMMFVRQGIALAIFLFSVRYIYGKNMYKYMMLISLAMLFHLSAIILVPLYFILNKRLSTRWYFIILLSSFCILPFNLIEMVANYIPIEFVRDKVTSYLTSDIWNKSNNISFSTFERLFIVCTSLIFYRKIDNSNAYFRIFFNLYFLGVVAYFITFNSYVFSERISIYCNVAAIFLLSYYFCLFKDVGSKIIYHIFLILLVCVFFLKTIIGNDVYTPYNSWLLATAFWN